MRLAFRRDISRIDAAGGHLEWRSPDLWIPVALVLLSIFFFADPLFSSKNFYFRDILNFHYPLRKVLIEAYGRGEFPLWNPYIYLGQPMLANPNYMAFYPTNILHLFLPFNYAFKLHFILHPILAGVGMYFLQRRLHISAWAAMAGALVYQFSGTVLSFLNLYNIIPAVTLLPWIGWAYLGALRGPWLRRSLLFGAILALQIIALEPLMFQCVLWLLAGLTVHYLLETPRKLAELGRVLKVGALGGIFAAGLAALQILPTLKLLPRTARGAGFVFDEVSLWSMHPLDLLNAIVPNLFGNYYQIGLATSWGEVFHNGREGYLVSFFVGSCTLLLAALSFISRRRKLQVILACVALGALTLALGKYNPLYQWLFDHVAFFQLGRYPSKYFLLATLALSVLASLGLETAMSPETLEPRRRRFLAAAGIGGLVVALVFLAAWSTWPLHGPHLEKWIRMGVEPKLVASKDFPAILAQLGRSVRSSGVFLLLGSVLVLVAPFWRRSRLLGGLLLLILAAELIPANLRLSPLISDADVDYVPPVNHFILQNGPPEPFRVAPTTLLHPIPTLKITAPNRSDAWMTLFYRMSGQPFFGLMSGIEYSLDRSVDYLNTRESEELWRASLKLQEPDALTLLAKLNSPIIPLLQESRDPRLRPLATFDTTSSLRLGVYWLEDTVSRAVFVANVEKASSQADALQRFLRPDFPYGTTVVLEDPGVAGKSGEPNAGSARILEHGSRRVSCQVEARTAGYLVLLDSYYPGWSATVDGIKAEVLKANYAFRAVAVPAGSHRVEFEYYPRSFYLGLAISLATLATGAFLLWAPKRRSPFIPPDSGS